MPFINVEIKARVTVEKAQWIEQTLLAHKADYKGLDHQIDTYFNVPNGRLKLREGNIENALIQYNRNNQADAKVSAIQLYESVPGSNLKNTLLAALGAKVVVDKERKIFFIDNVKFHIDQVKGLGHFMEIEAIDRIGDVGEEKLQEQCQYYQQLLEIAVEDLLAVSYSDLLLL